MVSTREELTVQIIPEVQVVERPSRQMSALSVAVPTLRGVDRILTLTGKQTVDIPGPQVLEDEEGEAVLYSQQGWMEEWLAS